MRKALVISLLFFAMILILSISPAYAQDEDINLENLPTQLGTAWGISTFAAGIFLSTFLSFTFIFPTLLATRDSEMAGLAVLFVGLGVMGFTIAIGWMPYWIMLLLVLIVASLWAGKITQGF